MTGSRLAGSASPYLRAHAGNPVPWFPWGADAFAEARRRDVPVMISIGYSTCHWCHVMARESFDDPATAAELAADFVSIKVDREEHPDVDAAYMAAAGAFTPHLGWPLTVFATPDGRAFHAGTYFPPTARQGVPAFRQVLAAVTEAWRERRDEVDGTATALADALAAAATPDPADALPTTADLAAAAARLLALEDAAHGGFGAGGPKFPMVPALRFLQAPALEQETPDAAGAADRALAAMAGSELFDDVDGGFFRYATRPDWTVPHYERMLTDNAGLIEVALAAGDLALAARVAGYLVDVLQQPAGGFGAAQDSESWIDGARSEGGFYTGDPARRATLEPPAVDGKVVTGWNGLAIGALADLARRTGDPDVLDAARAAADAVMESNVDAAGRLMRASLDEVASRAPAVLEDYGLLAGGLLRLAAATGEVAYAAAARDLVDTALGDGPAVDHALTLTAPPTGEGDHLTGTASVADAARRLWLLGAGDGYREAAEGLVKDGAVRALAEPAGHAGLLRVATDLAAPPRQVVVVADLDDPLVEASRAVTADLVIALDAVQSAAFAASGFELFDGKTTLDGRPTAYVCREFTCDSPTHDPLSLALN